MNRRNRTLVVIGLAVLLASLASYAVYSAIRRIPVREVEVATTFAVVAQERLPVGTLIDEHQVALVAWPQSAPVAGGFSNIADVVGRGLISEVAVNEPITETKLAVREAGGGLPPSIPPGMRAMSVRVNDTSGVAGFAVPGTRVDVIVIVTPEQQESVSRVVVSNVQVLTSGTRFDPESARTGEPISAPVVTLLVTPQDAERIALAQNEGQIMLALRNPLDVESVDTRGVRMSGLLAPPAAPPVRTVVRGQPRVVAPPPPPAPPTYTVETIRGAERETVTVE